MMWQAKLDSALLSLGAASLLTLAGCGDTGSSATGDIEVSVAANEAVRVGFPHTEEGFGELAFVDDWSVTIDTFVVSIQRFELLELTNEGDGSVEASWGGASLLDIAAEEDGDVQLGMMSDVPEGRYDIRFELSPPDSSTMAANIPSELSETMVANGWSLYVKATATPGAGHPEFSEPITLDLGMDLNATYFDCNNGADGTKGFVVIGNSVSEAYIYPHIVHLFWDNLGAGDEELRFDAMARAAGEDRVLTIEELDTVDLTAPELAGPDGIPLYDDAGLLDEYTLGAYVRRAMLESFHFNGIGFCKKTLGN
ncbi:MAG: hypothetical protein AAFX99_04815 [Myxococcota bacterium]